MRTNYAGVASLPAQSLSLCRQLDYNFSTLSRYGEGEKENGSKEVPRTKQRRENLAFYPYFTYYPSWSTTC